MKYRSEEIKAGLVVIAALVIFSAMVVLIGGSRFWEKPDVYHIRFSAIGGLEPGAAVRLGGFRVGRVLEIQVAPDDISKIEVTIGVKPETPIYRGVMAGVYTLGLVGDYYVLLTQKPGANQPLPPGSDIPSRDMVEMGDLLAQAAQLSQTLSSSIEAVVGVINRTLSGENIEHIQAALQGISRFTTEGEKSLSAITTDLRTVLARLNTLVTHVDNLVLENREELRSTIATLKVDSQKAGQLIDHLDARVAGTGNDLDETMVNLMEVSENLRLLTSQLRRQPWRLIYRGGVKK